MFSKKNIKNVIFKDFSHGVIITPTYSGRNNEYEVSDNVKVKIKKDTIIFYPKKKTVHSFEFINLNFYNINEVFFENSKIVISDLRKHLEDFVITISNSDVRWEKENLFTSLWLKIKDSSKVNFVDSFACINFYGDIINSNVKFHSKGLISECELNIDNGLFMSNDKFFIQSLYGLNIENDESILEINIMESSSTPEIKDSPVVDIKVLDKNEFESLSEALNNKGNQTLITKSELSDAYHTVIDKPMCCKYVDEYFIIEDCNNGFIYPSLIRETLFLSEEMKQRAIDPVAYDQNIKDKKFNEDVKFFKEFFNKLYPTEHLNEYNRDRFITLLTQFSEDKVLVNTYDLTSEIELKNIEKMCFVLDIPFKTQKDIASF